MRNRHIGASVILCLVAGGHLFAGSSDKPPALRAAEEARSRALVCTAAIEFSETCTVNTKAPDGPPGPPRRQYYSWRCAEDDYITVYRGDAEGVVMRDAEGRPRDDLDYSGPMHFLVQNNEVWQHVQDSPLVSVWPEDRQDFWRLHDLRLLGLQPVTFGRDLEEETRKYGYPPLQYETTADGSLYVVTASSERGKYRWWIDSEKNWSVVRTGVWLDDRQIGETRFALQEIDGVWFPTRIERYRLGAGDVEPSTVISILSAEFNRPYHPRKLTPADIGIEPGASITYEERNPSPLMMWDGDQPVPPEEFLQRVGRGELSWGPTMVREVVRLRVKHGSDGPGQPKEL